MNAHRFTFVKIASLIVIVLGVIMLANIPLPFLARGGTAESTSAASVYALVTVYGLAGLCAGPLLRAVLTVAAVSGNALTGGVITLIFAAGMALPLLILAALWGRLPFVKRLVRPREVSIGHWRNTWTGIVGGALTIAVGVLLLTTSGTTALSGILGAADQAALEGTVLQEAGRDPDLLVLGIVVAVALGAWALVRISRRRARTRGSGPRGAADTTATAEPVLTAPETERDT